MTTNTEGGATIAPRPNGPYIITGNFTIVDPEGRQFKVEGDRVALCRCGQSNTKPFCDVTHRTCGFTSEVKAPE